MNLRKGLYRLPLADTSLINFRDFDVLGPKKMVRRLKGQFPVDLAA